MMVRYVPYLSIFFATYVTILVAGKDPIDRNRNECCVGDSLYFLSGKAYKFWNRVDANGFTNADEKDEILNWKFSKNGRLQEYIYNKKRREYKVLYQGDLGIGYWKYWIKNDTLFIDGVGIQKYLIRKLTNDSLTVQHIGNDRLWPTTRYIKSPK
jgi:hypothetical protein